MGFAISKVLFQPPSPTYAWTDDTDRISVNDEFYIPAYFIPYEGSKLCILYSHGNATDLGQMKPFLEMLRNRLKINVFAYEYIGYGLSRPADARPSERRCQLSIQAAVDYLTTKYNIPTTSMILFGTSLGSGPSVWIASRSNYAFMGLMLQSPFTSVVRIKFDTGPNLYFDMFRNLDCMHKIRCPVFFIHGCHDQIVPFEHSKQLYDQTRYPFETPLWIEHAGHNNILEVVGIDAYVRAIREFISHIRRSQSHPQRHSHLPCASSLPSSSSTPSSTPTAGPDKLKTGSSSSFNTGISHNTSPTIKTSTSTSDPYEKDETERIGQRPSSPESTTVSAAATTT